MDQPVDHDQPCILPFTIYLTIYKADDIYTTTTTTMSELSPIYAR